MERVGFQPELARQTDGLETGFRPPVRFLARAVQFAVVSAAQWDDELVADLETETAGLRGNRKWWASQGWRPQTRQGCFATNRRCCLSRSRLVSGRVSKLLSMRERISSFAGGRVQFGRRVVALIQCRLDLGELGLKRLSDLVPICRRQGICPRPRAKGPGIEIVLGFQPCDLGQQLVHLRIAEASPDKTAARSPPLRGPWSVLGVVSRPFGPVFVAGGPVCGLGSIV